jgi:hypothetical protein
LLALLIPGLHRHAHIRSGRVDRASIVPAEKLALIVSTGDNQAPAVMIQVRHQSLVREFPRTIADVSRCKMLFAENVQGVGFNYQVALAARPAFVALKHGEMVAHNLAGDASLFAPLLGIPRFPSLLRPLNPIAGMLQATKGQILRSDPMA